MPAAQTATPPGPSPASASRPAPATWARVARLVALGLLLMAAVLVSLGLGRFPVRPGETLAFLVQELTGRGSIDPARLKLLENVLLHIRLPRVLAAVLIGAALSSSGAAFQGLFVTRSSPRGSSASSTAPPSAQPWACSSSPPGSWSSSPRSWAASWPSPWPWR